MLSVCLISFFFALEEFPTKPHDDWPMGKAVWLNKHFVFSRDTCYLPMLAFLELLNVYLFGAPWECTS